VALARADAYRAQFRGAVLPELGRIPGFLWRSLSQRLLAGRLEFLVLTRWQSPDAVRAFPGGDLVAAVVEPAAAVTLFN